MSLASSSSTSGSGLASGKKIPLTRQRIIDFKSNNGDRKLRQQQSSTTSTSGSNDVPLVNYNSVIYFADITINTSQFTVLVDTGSSDLWISCAYISSATCSSTCPAKSNLIQYGSGNVCIQGSYAKVTIGDVSVANYVVSVAQGRNVLPTSSTNLLPGGSQGLLGLGYQALATIPTPGGQFIDYLTSFSIYLTDDAYSDGSFLLLNAVDEEFIAKEKLKPYTIPLKEQAHWTIGMTAFQVGNDTAFYPCSTSSSSGTSSDGGATPGCRSIVDTGTSLLTMPNALFNSFASTYLIPRGCFVPSDSSTGGSSSSTSTSSLYVCPRSASLPRLAFTFGNYTFYLEGVDYVIQIPQSTYVVVELQPTGSGSLSNTWIIGDTFLKQYYSSYATNQSVTFYCKEGSCAEGSVAAATFPNSGSSSNPLTGGDNNGGSANTSDDSSGSKLSSTETILVVAVSVLGLIVLLVAVVQLRRCMIARRRRRAANATNAPIQGAYYPGNLTPTGR